jgi:uracil-DNA glycosylase
LDLLLPTARCLVALGGYAFDGLLRILRDRGHRVPSPKPAFSHGAEVALGHGPTLLASYHPSQQNTFTGTLTREAFDRIWDRARELVA